MLTVLDSSTYDGPKSFNKEKPQLYAKGDVSCSYRETVSTKL